MARMSGWVRPALLPSVGKIGREFAGVGGAIPTDGPISYLARLGSDLAQGDVGRMQPEFGLHGGLLTPSLPGLKDCSPRGLVKNGPVSSTPLFMSPSTAPTGRKQNGTISG